VTATNRDVGTAYSTQVTGVTLQQVIGRKCTPVITSPTTFPVVLGDIASGGTASTPITIDFASCDDGVRFTLNAPWSSATYETGVRTRQRISAGEVARPQKGRCAATSAACSPDYGGGFASDGIGATSLGLLTPGLPVSPPVGGLLRAETQVQMGPCAPETQSRVVPHRFECRMSLQSAVPSQLQC
jgi:hypothetical protein